VRVVCTDRDPRAPGFRLADEGHVADARDIDRITALGRQLRVDGIVSEQTDVAVLTVASAADALGLPSVGRLAAFRATNKTAMRSCLRDAGVPVPRFREVGTVDEAVAAAAEIGYPVVVKPIDDQASRGVLKVWREEELREQFPRTIRFGTTSRALVEEMMVGPESSVECVVTGGTVVPLAVSDKVKCAPPYAFDLELVYPARFDPEVVRQLLDMNARVVAAVGIDNALTHAEFIMTKGGARLLEIAARGCGAGIATDLIPAMTGVDPIALRVRQALGERVEAPHVARPRAGVLGFFTAPPGTVSAIGGVDEARSLEGILKLDLEVTIGQPVGEISSADLRLGSFLGVSDTVREVETLARRVRDLVHIDVTRR
jgi:biotin carboxylase